MNKARFAVGIIAVLALAAPASTASAAIPNDEATCVGLASAFFGQEGIRDDTAACIANGQG
jgi:hypothetical protein